MIRRIVLLLLLTMSFVVSTFSQEVDTLQFAGQAGVIHVSVDPDSIGLVAEQDSTFDALLAWDFKNKILYGYHPDSIVGRKWNPVANGAIGQNGDSDSLFVSVGSDSIYLKKILEFTSSQTLVNWSASGNEGDVLLILNLDFANLDPNETNKVATRLMEEPLAKEKLRDSLLVTLYHKVENYTGSFIDLPFDIPISDADINAKFEYVRDGFKSIYQTYFTVGNDGNGNRRRVNFLIPAKGENFIFKLYP